jgi:hypothetical protein
MDLGTVLNTMRDPAGVPAHPLLFQLLMVLTWVPHIAFVNLTLGAAGLAIYGFHRRAAGPHWEALSIALTKVAKVGVSLLIVLGVAPLLFTQVIYDPQWYVSNILSGQWVIAFIATLIVAYCLWFAFYYANQAGAKRHIAIYAWVALLLFCLDGLIMHALAYQAILPERWMEWYGPNGVVDTRGAALHAISWPRFAFILSLSVPAIGLFLIAYARYFAPRKDRDPALLDFARRLGQRLAAYGFIAALLLFLLWQIAHPSETGLSQHPFGWLLAATLAAMAVWLLRLDVSRAGYVPLCAGLVVFTLLAIWRELIRVAHLRPLGYSVSDYPVHADWPSMFLFFSTLIGVGGLVGGYYLTLIFRAGRTPGMYVASGNVDRLGTAAVVVLALWIAVFFVYGIVIWLGNTFLA